MRMPVNANAFFLRFFSPKSAAPRRKENATLERRINDRIEMATPRSLSAAK